MEQAVLNSVLNNHKEAIEKNHEDINHLIAEVTTIKYVLIAELADIYKKLFGSEFANTKKELIEKVINDSLECTLDKISKIKES